MITSSSATTLPILNKSRFERLNFPLAPLSEQHRMVSKLDGLMKKAQQTQEILAQTQEKLKLFRLSVLKNAVTGKLTENWRKENPNVESAEEMIFRVIQEQEENYQSALKTYKKEGKRKPSRPEKFKYLDKIENPIIQIENLPSKWTTTYFFNLCILQRGHDLPKQDRKEGKYPIVSSAGVTGYHNEYKGKNEGVFVGRSGSVGAIHYINQDYWALNTVLFVKEFNQNIPKYVYYFLKNFHPERFSASTAVPTLNRNNFTFEPINLPPLSEQAEIVRRVEQLFSYADALEAKLQKAVENAETLPQSILKKAFEGRLVPQDASEESAEILLQKIKSSE